MVLNDASSCFWHTLGPLKRHCIGTKLVIVVTASYQWMSYANTYVEIVDLFVFLAGMLSLLMVTVWRNFAKPLDRPNISQQLSLRRPLKAKAYQVIKHPLFYTHLYSICLECKKSFKLFTHLNISA